MEIAVVVLSIVVGVQSLCVPVLLWRVLKLGQDIDALDQVVEAVVEANRKR